jgi:hypothetical protein
MAIDSSARVHAGFLARFRETLSAAAPHDLHRQVGSSRERALLRSIALN